MQLLITGPSGKCSTVPLAAKAMSLGRAIDNELAYPDDPALSRRHLLIEPVDGTWMVRDCGSRNGTILNDTALLQPSPLHPGDRIFVGHLTIEVESARREQITPTLPSPSGTPSIVTTLDEVLGHTSSGGKPPSTPIVGSSRGVSALIRAGQELAGHRPLNELFEVILDLALSAVEARRGMILTTEQDGLSVRARRGEEFLLSSSVRSQVLLKKTSMIIGDAQFDAALREQKSIVAQRIRSIMAVPLQTADRVIGLIYVDNASILRPFSREDLDLLTVMANVAAIRIEHARLNIIEQQEQLTQSELSQAAEIQRSLLPDAAPSVPNFDLSAFNLTCRAVGGDYYDFLPYSEGRLGLFVGDVCGKGLPAAIMMSSLQARVQMFTETQLDPATALTTLNRNMAGRFPLGRFITAFYGVLDPATGQLLYANAGHNYPLLLRQSGAVEELRGGSMVLCLFPHIEYRLQSVELAPGDMLILYSDGVTEAVGPDEQQFGEQRLAAFLHAHRQHSCEDLVSKLVGHVHEWCQSDSFADDFTILLVRHGKCDDARE